MNYFALIGLAVLLSTTPQKNINKDENPFIVDTDFACDCDDIAAVRIATQLDREGVIDLQAVMLCTSGTEKALHGLLVEDGYPNMKIGLSANNREEGCAYTEVLESYSKGKMKTADAVRLYKYVLYRSENKVKIVTTGYLTNIYELLRDKTGYKLIKEKVDTIYVTGGVGYDNNMSAFKEASEATRYIVENCPCEIVFFNGEIGSSFKCGGATFKNHPNDPLSQSFAAYSQYWNGWDITDGRWAWDPFTVYVAAYGYDKTMTRIIPSKATYSTTYKTIDHDYKTKNPNCYVVELMSSNLEWYTQELDRILERRYE